MVKGFPGQGNLSFFTAPFQVCQSCPDAFMFLSYPVTWGSFLRLRLYKKSSASFQLVFCENCSTCRCIFDVFVWGGGGSSTSFYSAILVSASLLRVFLNGEPLLSLNCIHVLNIKVIYSNIIEQIITVISPHDNNTIY